MSVHGMIRALFLVNPNWGLPDQTGAQDLQRNQAAKIIRTVVWGIAGLVVLIVVLIGVTASALPGCSGCHNEKSFVGQTQKSAHAKIACVRCHVASGVAPRIVYAYHVIFDMTLKIAPPTSGPSLGVQNAACVSCHTAVMQGVVDSNGLRILHSKCSKGRLCTDCHSATAHGTAVKWVKTSQMNQCLDCHDTTKVRSNCTMCHRARTAQQRLQSGEWAITHGRNWKVTHGMGDWKTCTSCHPSNYCVRCHGLSLPHDTDFLRTHPAQAKAQRKDCNVCHKQTFCDACHGLPMPHPRSFTPAHSSIVKKQGSSVCLRCHVQTDCDNCHVKHVHPGGAISAPSAGAK